MEINGILIKKKPAFINYIPWIGGKTATALYPNIWVPGFLYEELNTKEISNHYFYSILIHEAEHIKRQKETGLIKWLLKYILSRKFRFEEEIIACSPQIKYLKAHGQRYDIERKAKWLSSWVYLWCTDYQTAYRKLVDL